MDATEVQLRVIQVIAFCRHFKLIDQSQQTGILEIDQSEQIRILEIRF